MVEFNISIPEYAETSVVTLSHTFPFGSIQVIPVASQFQNATVSIRMWALEDDKLMTAEQFNATINFTTPKSPCFEPPCQIITISFEPLNGDTSFAKEYCQAVEAILYIPTQSSWLNDFTVNSDSALTYIQGLTISYNSLNITTNSAPVQVSCVL